jgi:hypothetical protein
MSEFDEVEVIFPDLKWSESREDLPENPTRRIFICFGQSLKGPRAAGGLILSLPNNIFGSVILGSVIYYIQLALPFRGWRLNTLSRNLSSIAPT